MGTLARADTSAEETRKKRFVLLLFCSQGVIGLVLLTFERWPPVLQVLLVFVAFAGGLGLASVLVHPGLLRRWLEDVHGYDRTRSWSFLWPAVDTVYLLCIFPTTAFVLLSSFLYLQGVAEVSDVTTSERVPDGIVGDPTSSSGVLEDPVNDIFLFYVWSFLDAVPVLAIPQTVRWEPRFEFNDHFNPPLLLLYKLVVIIPTIALGRRFVTDLRLRRKSGSHPMSPGN